MKFFDLKKKKQMEKYCVLNCNGIWNEDGKPGHLTALWESPKGSSCLETLIAEIARKQQQQNHHRQNTGLLYRVTYVGIHGAALRKARSLLVLENNCLIIMKKYNLNQSLCGWKINLGGTLSGPLHLTSTVFLQKKA